MTRLNFIVVLVVISSVLTSCSQEETSATSNQIQPEVKSNDSIQDSNIKKSVNLYSDSTNNAIISDSSRNINKVGLKVEIDGKEYFKKKSSDFRIGDSFIFRTKDKRFDYDIRTGRFVPSGVNTGKVTIE